MDRSHEHEAGGPSGPTDRRYIPVLPLGTAVLRQWRLIIGTALAFVVVAVALVALFAPRGFAATSRFMPENREQRDFSGVPGIVAQLGLGALGQRSPLAFYVELLKSREILRRAVLAEYRFEVETDGRPDTLSGTLVDLYGIAAPTETDRIRAATSRLRHDVEVESDAPSGLVTLETAAPWPKLAEALNERLLELLNRFNVETRQSQARAESEFVGERLEAERARLRDAEAELRRFLERNRQFESPDLQFQAARLQREVELRQQVYTALATAHEDARIRAVRSTPVITILEQPAGSARRMRWPVVVIALLVALFGLAVGTGLAVVRSLMDDYRRAYPDEYRDFVAARRAVLEDLSPRRLAGRARRLIGS